MKGLVAILLFLALLAAVGVGLAAGFDGLYTGAALAAIILAAAILYNPLYGLLLFAVLVPLENLILVAEGFTGLKLIGLTVFGAWFLRKIASRDTWRELVASRFFVAGLAFLLLILLSIFWAANPAVTRAGAIQLTQMIVLGFIVLDVARSWRDLDWLAKALVLGGLVAALLTIQQSQLLGVRRAGDEIAGGVNATAAVLLTLIPLAFYLLRTSSRLIWRALGITFIVTAVVAIVLTLSRLNLLLLPPTLGAMIVLTWRDGKNRALIVGTLVLGVVGLSRYTDIDKLLERGDTIAPYIEQTLGQSASSSVSGRGYHLKIGLEIFKDHPFLGVGYNNYGEYFLRQYQFSVAGRDLLYTSRRNPHSSYIGLLADLGILGLFLWISVLWISIRAVALAWKVTGSENRRAPPHALVQSLAVALSLHVLPFGFYMPNQQDKLLWLLLGMCVAAGAIVAIPRFASTELYVDSHDLRAESTELLLRGSA